MGGPARPASWSFVMQSMQFRLFGLMTHRCCEIVRLCPTSEMGMLHNLMEYMRIFSETNLLRLCDVPERVESRCKLEFTIFTRNG